MVVEVQHLGVAGRTERDGDDRRGDRERAAHQLPQPDEQRQGQEDALDPAERPQGDERVGGPALDELALERQERRNVEVEVAIGRFAAIQLGTVVGEVAFQRAAEVAVPPRGEKRGHQQDQRQGGPQIASEFRRRARGRQFGVATAGGGRWVADHHFLIVTDWL